MRSRFLLSVVALLSLLAAGAHAAENSAESEARLRKDVTYLASDALEGRGAGTEGLNKAADYIARRFAEMGLKTDVFEGQPFQNFEIVTSAEMGPAEKNRLSLEGPQTRIELKRGETFTPLATGGSGVFDAPLVFAGYGITAKNLKQGNATIDYDDYAKIDAKGKVVILLRKEPQQQDDKSPFNGKNNTTYATYAVKLRNAIAHGTAAVIVVNDKLELTNRRDQDAKLLKASLDALAAMRDKLATAVPGTADFDQLVGSVAKTAAEAAELGKQLTANPDVLLPFDGAGPKSTQRTLPVYFCTRAAIDSVVKAALGKDLATLEREIDSDLMPRSAELTGWRAAGQSEVKEVKAKVKNVVGVLEGSGPLADETIVVGAHYDHLGFGGEGSLAPWTTEIHNGADDNGSGTATLLEVAQRLSATSKPRRRFVFIAFAGEELGLYGSDFYTRQPRFPLEKTIAMFNLDMVGRLKDENLIVYGTGTAKEFDPLAEKLCQQFGFKITKHAGGLGPSDHASFYKKQIPVLHLFTGTHRDYHRPSDDSDKLNIPGMRRIADWLVEAIQITDAADQRPTFTKNDKFEQITDNTQDPASGERASFGSMPAYPNPAKDGVLLEAVLEGGVAEKAGIKGGDVLLQIGDKPTTDLDAFQEALTHYKPGDKVKVIVRRGEKRVETEVTLGRRRGP